jgi:2-polyprenyl-3-methyl-5-hydroxy-6-metoxy-1,4-benzoquinol methylase
MRRSDCTVFFDQCRERLVYLGSTADQSYWDGHWSPRVVRELITRDDFFVVSRTADVLEKGSRILDAGCGISQTVWSLSRAQFEAYGIDYARETIATVKSLVPEIDVRFGDVRELPFSDNFFDGIWSLGVIEHFYDGFDDIVREMWRATKPGGYAFVTVPSMSPLRRLKARLGAYPLHQGQREGFYQFVLPQEHVIERFTSSGWAFEKSIPLGGFKGLKDESGSLYKLLQGAYDMKFPGSRYVWAGVNRLLAPLSFHTVFYQFRKSI